MWGEMWGGGGVSSVCAQERGLAEGRGRVTMRDGREGCDGDVSLSIEKDAVTRTSHRSRA